LAFIFVLVSYLAYAILNRKPAINNINNSKIPKGLNGYLDKNLKILN